MPIYVYECADCGKEHEILQKLADPPASVCPSCGQKNLSKQLTAAGFHLKGNGWYASDFKNKSPSAPAEGASTKTETKAPEVAKTPCGHACSCH